MDHYDAETEARFFGKFDCKFPYHDHALASNLIKEGRSISSNAMFGVLYEICMKPQSDGVTRNRQHELLEEWAASSDHALTKPLVYCASALIDEQYLPWQEMVGLMEQISKFKGQYAALSIALASGDCASQEGNDQLEAANERIRHAWASAQQLGLPTEPP